MAAKICIDTETVICGGLISYFLLGHPTLLKSRYWGVKILEYTVEPENRFVIFL